MISVSLPYDRRHLDLSLPERNFQVLHPREEKPAVNDEHILASFDQPVKGPTLFRFLQDRKKLLIVVSDATRQTGAPRILRLMAQYIRSHQLEPSAVRIVISTGIHRTPTGDELHHLTGNGVVAGAEIMTHDADDDTQLSDWGRTSSGNRIRLNHQLNWADGVVICGGIGFHYFAGFSGGRKSILPGLAARETITHNHRLVFSADGQRHPAVRTASLDGNPVHEDMVDAIQQIGSDMFFLVNTVMNTSGAINHMVCGTILESHRKACRDYLAGHAIPLAEPVDVVVASAGGHPRDINMVQSHKTVEMARYGLREGGRMVVLAACPEGMGNADFFSWFRYRSEADFHRELIRHYVINGQTALSLFEKTRRYTIYFMSDLPDDQVRQMGMIPVHDPAQALKLATTGLNSGYRGLVLPEAAVTFCQVKGDY